MFDAHCPLRKPPSHRLRGFNLSPGSDVVAFGTRGVQVEVLVRTLEGVPSANEESWAC